MRICACRLPARTRGRVITVVAIRRIPRRRKLPAHCGRATGDVVDQRLLGQGWRHRARSLRLATCLGPCSTRHPVGWRVTVASNVVAKALAARPGKAHLCRHRARSCLRVHPPALLLCLWNHAHHGHRDSARRPQHAVHTTLDARTYSAPCARHARRNATRSTQHAACCPVFTLTRRRGAGLGGGTNAQPVAGEEVRNPFFIVLRR